MQNSIVQRVLHMTKDYNYMDVSLLIYYYLMLFDDPCIRAKKAYYLFKEITDILLIEIPLQENTKDNHSDNLSVDLTNLSIDVYRFLHDYTILDSMLKGIFQVDVENARLFYEYTFFRHGPFCTAWLEDKNVLELVITHLKERMSPEDFTQLVTNQYINLLNDSLFEEYEEGLSCIRNYVESQKGSHVLLVNEMQVGNIPLMLMITKMSDGFFQLFYDYFKSMLESKIFIERVIEEWLECFEWVENNISQYDNKDSTENIKYALLKKFYLITEQLIQAGVKSEKPAVRWDTKIMLKRLWGVNIFINFPIERFVRLLGIVAENVKTPEEKTEIFEILLKVVDTYPDIIQADALSNILEKIETNAPWLFYILEPAKLISLIFSGKTYKEKINNFRVGAGHVYEMFKLSASMYSESMVSVVYPLTRKLAERLHALITEAQGKTGMERSILDYTMDFLSSCTIYRRHKEESLMDYIRVIGEMVMLKWGPYDKPQVERRIKENLFIDMILRKFLEGFNTTKEKENFLKLNFCSDIL